MEIPACNSSGFCVWAEELNPGYRVGYEGWHEEFTDLDAALNCFAFGLSRACRLRVFRRGAVDYKWQVLYQENGNWRVDSETGSIFFPYWRRKHMRELQNDLLEPDRVSSTPALSNKP